MEKVGSLPGSNLGGGIDSSDGFQAAAAKQMRTALFWVITQRAVVISLPENYHYSLRNNPEEGGSRIIRGFSPVPPDEIVYNALNQATASSIHVLPTTLATSWPTAPSCTSGSLTYIHTYFLTY